GDVYSSWRAPVNSETLEQDHYVELEDSGTAPMYQWGMSPQDFAIKSSASATEIMENSGAEQHIYTITSSDATATYSLGDSSDSALFSVDADSGEVTLIANPDFDLKANYSFEVVATNSDAVSLSQIVSLAIVERDPSIPVFESGDTAVAIDENSGENQVIYTAVAANIDTDLVSGPITYNLTDDSDGAFTIDSVSGAVTLVNDPDADISDSLSFTVSAVNAENNSVEQVVSLEINNLDDTAPVMVSSDTGSVDENSGSGQVVYTADADDSADVSSGISYSIVDNGVAASEINIPVLAPNTQHVYVSESTKSEDNTQETVVISYDADTAASTGLGLQIHFDSSVLSVDALFDVLDTDNIFAYDTPIADTNDDDNDASTDMYLSLGWASLFGTWPGSAPTELATVTFNLLDTTNDSSTINLVSSSHAAGYNYAGQSHDIALGVGTSLFSIDANSGEVTLLENPDFEVKSEYSFDVIATDTAGNLSAAQTVTLSVNDIDESPMITSGDLDVVLEGSDQVVYTATSNIDGAAFSLVDNTVYPAVANNSEPAVTVVSIPDLAAATQHVYVSESTKSEDGSQAIVKVSYNADDSTLTGLGLRIHYDSSAFTLSDISNVLSSDLFIPPTTSATADTNDYDNDASTDSFVLASWTSLFGQWPNAAPTDLMTMTFDIAEGASGSSTINLTSSSNAAGFTFDGQSHDVV
ncbi:MAG: cadherin repeat domain-containing protein, partial [Porticoccaceae bacterium]|nr:cadherin repeat domain-containing protein [Porticoccaceae bacterium]